MDISGKIVLLRGASEGIGLATARLLVDQGAVARSAARLEQLASLLPDTLAVPTDMRDARAGQF